MQHNVPPRGFWEKHQSSNLFFLGASIVVVILLFLFGKLLDSGVFDTRIELDPVAMKKYQIIKKNISATLGGILKENKSMLLYLTLSRGGFFKGDSINLTNLKEENFSDCISSGSIVLLIPNGIIDWNSGIIKPEFVPIIAAAIKLMQQRNKQLGRAPYGLGTYSIGTFEANTNNLVISDMHHQALENKQKCMFGNRELSKIRVCDGKMFFVIDYAKFQVSLADLIGNEKTFVAAINNYKKSSETKTYIMVLNNRNFDIKETKEILDFEFNVDTPNLVG